MILTNSQNNVERSAIDASLKHSDYDVLASKGDSLQFDKKFGPLLTYSPADNLIYYIGYEHEPTGDVTTDTDIQRRIFGLDLEDTSSYKHHVKKYGDAFIDPNESHNVNFKGSLSLSGDGDFLAIVANESYPEVFGSKTGAGRFPDEPGRGLPVDGEITIEFWIKPRGIAGKYDYQTVIHHGPLMLQNYAGGINRPTHDGFGSMGPHGPFSEFGIFMGAGSGGWEEGKIYVKAHGGNYSAIEYGSECIELSNFNTSLSAGDPNGLYEKSTSLFDSKPYWYGPDAETEGAAAYLISWNSTALGGDDVWGLGTSLGDDNDAYYNALGYALPYGAPLNNHWTNPDGLGLSDLAECLSPTDTLTSDQQLHLKSATALEEGTWYHVAVVKKAQSGADLVTLYIDGAAEDTDTWTTDGAWNEEVGKNPTYIGVQPQLSVLTQMAIIRSGEIGDLQFYGYFNGNINEVRVSYEAVYNSNFDPSTFLPFSDQEPADLSKVTMLIQSDCQGSAYGGIQDYVGGHSITTPGVSLSGSLSVRNMVESAWVGPTGTCGYLKFDVGWAGVGALYYGEEVGLKTTLLPTIEEWTRREWWGPRNASVWTWHDRSPITIEFWVAIGGVRAKHSKEKDVGIAHDVIIGQALHGYLESGWTVAMEQDGKLSLNIYDNMYAEGQEEAALSRFAIHGMYGDPTVHKSHIITPLRYDDGKWVHVAITTTGPISSVDWARDAVPRAGPVNWRFYVDGKLQGSASTKGHVSISRYSTSPSKGNLPKPGREFYVGAGSCLEGTSSPPVGNCYHTNMYFDDLRWSIGLLYDGNSFTVPTKKFPKTSGKGKVGLLLHLDASEEVTEITTFTVEDGGYGLCTFDPLTLDTETVLKFDEPQYKDEDLGRTVEASGGDGDKWEQERTYNIPRDIIYSAYDNCLWLLFNRHYQHHSAMLVSSPPEEYTGTEGLTEAHFNSNNSFILYKYDLDSRKITYQKTLWDVWWNDDSFSTGWMQINLMKGVKGLNNKYFHYPDFIRHMFTSLSINPRSGEVIGLHSYEGRGYQNLNGLDGSSLTYILGAGSGPPESHQLQSEDITSAHCPTGKKCINVNVNDGDSIWKIDSHGEAWHFTTRLNDGSDQTIPDANFSSNNCMVYNEPTGEISEEIWTSTPCDLLNQPIGNNLGLCWSLASSSRPFEMGGCPKRLVFSPITGSHYIPTKSEDAYIDFLYEDKGGSKSISDNFFLLSADIAASIQDGIYISSMEKMLYLTYASDRAGLIYVNPCKPTPTARGASVSEGIGKCSTDGNIGPNHIIWGRKGFDEEIVSAESLIYCPSNDRIYLLGTATLLKLRPHNLSIEESYTVPTGGDLTGGKGLKTFIPIYSHVNDVIYYMSNDNQRQSFCFKPNY